MHLCKLSNTFTNTFIKKMIASQYSFKIIKMKLYSIWMNNTLIWLKLSDICSALSVTVRICLSLNWLYIFQISSLFTLMTVSVYRNKTMQDTDLIWHLQSSLNTIDYMLITVHICIKIFWFIMSIISRRMSINKHFVREILLLIVCITAAFS